ncbi:MAG TPA: protein kinase [Polyangiaceae bacterium]|nr:protein kinase [Polyangiaceae bacterium]
MNKPAELPAPGDLFEGKYRIQHLLGKGGMGAVFAAHHSGLNIRVAVKFLLAEAAENHEANARFQQEARAAAQIQNEHVARVVDVSTESGLPYMVMEYLEGQDLSQLLEVRTSLPPEEACSYVLQACDAIHAAHKSGIIHRDLKPSNLFLARRPDGSTILKVLDFGISKAQNGLGPMSGALTSTKAMLGSPLYMSPEQLRSSKSVDARADIWALGVILYELITGSVPYHGENLGELFAAILEQDPVPVRQRAPHVPPELELVVMRCLQRQPNARFSTVAELALHLAVFAPGDARLPVVAAARAQLQSGGFPNASPASYTQPVGASHPMYHPGAGAMGGRASQPSVPSFGGTGSSANGQLPNATAALGGGFVPPGHPATSQAAALSDSVIEGPPVRSNTGLLLGLAAVMVLAAVGIGGYTISQRSAAASAASSAPPEPSSAPSVAVTVAPSATAPEVPPPPTAAASVAPVPTVPEAPPVATGRPAATGKPAAIPTGGKKPPTGPTTAPTTAPTTPPTAKPASTLQTSR